MIFEEAFQIKIDLISMPTIIYQAFSINMNAKVTKSER